MSSTMKSETKPGWKVNPATCNGCGDCMVLCPVGAIKIVKKVATMIDSESCCQNSCRVCELICPEKAITAY